MIRRSSLLALEVAIGLLATLALGVGLIYWRLSAGPIEMAGLKQHIEAQLSAARGGRPVRIDRIQLGWGEGASALQVRAMGVRSLDAQGHELARAREVSIGLGLDRLMVGTISVVEAHFHGGQVTITAARDGSTGIAFGPPGAPADIVLPASKSNATLQEQAIRALDSLAAAFRPIGPGGDLHGVSFDDSRLTIVDEASGGRLSAADAAFDLERNNARLTLTASASLIGRNGPAPFRMSIATDTAFKAAVIDLTVRGARPQALTLSGTLGPLANLTTPVTLTISAALDRKEGFTRLKGEADLGAGVLMLGGGKLDLSGGKLRGRYDLAADTLYIDDAALNGSGTKVRGQARLQHASAIFTADANAPARFEIASPRIEFEMPGAFSGRLAIDRVSAAGVLRPDQSAIDIEKFEADVDHARMHVAGRFFWGDDGAGIVRPGLKLDGGVDGMLTPQTVLRFWPMNLAAQARDWCDGALKSGRLFNTALHVDFAPKDLAGGALADEKLALTFDYDSAGVLYVEGMAPISGAQGRAEVHGNSFSAVVKKGAIGDIEITNGLVTLPRLYPSGALAVYKGHAVGEARSVVNLLRQAPIGLDARLPFDPSSIVGRGQADFAIRRPLGGVHPSDATQFSVDGRFDNVGATAKSGDYTLSQWKLRVTGDDKALTLSGPLALPRSSADLVWTERVRAKVNPSTVALKGKMDADDLVSLGFPILKYASGPVMIEAHSTGLGIDINKGDVRLDFAGAAINLEKGFWKKSPGTPATVRFTVARQADKSLLLSGIEARGGGMNVSGVVRVNDSGDLLEANLPRVVLPGSSESSMTAARTPAGVLQVTVNGAFLNVGPFFAADPPKAPSADQMLATTQRYIGKPGALSTAYEISADIDRLRFRADADISKSRMVYASDGVALTRLFVTGLDPEQQPFDLSIIPAPGRPTGKLSFRSEDAGFAARAITGVTNVKGGRVEAEGAWTFGENPSAQITVKAKGFTLVRAPAMAHLLSSVASLTGMVETLNGQGITFTDLDAPMTMTDGKLLLADCRAAGPSLGITAKGAVNLYSGALDVDGVLVPSYGLNSMLGNLPLLGGLFTSRKGEGVFGITYSVHGPSDNPRVGVNPLSAITPGILRRIFEPVPKRAPPVAAVPQKAG